MKKILYIDDVSSNLKIMEIVANGSGVEMLCFANYEDAINVMDDSFDIVVIDYYMPGKNGVEVMEILRAISSKPSFHIITADLNMVISDLPDFVDSIVHKGGSIKKLMKDFKSL